MCTGQDQAPVTDRPTSPGDPYAALFFLGFQYFLVLRFALVFAW
jgi:hypothetical protein